MILTKILAVPTNDQILREKKMCAKFRMDISKTKKIYFIVLVTFKLSIFNLCVIRKILNLYYTFHLQSSYFDCDDSDSFSEVSNSDEYDDDTMNVFNNSFELLMYANCYSDDTMTVNGISTIKQRQRQKVVRCSQEQRQPNFTCADVNCNAREFCGVDRDSYNMAVNGGEEAANGTEGTYVINQNGLHSVQCNEGNELENCTSLNGLSLRDANIDMPLSTGSENRGQKHVCGHVGEVRENIILEVRENIILELSKFLSDQIKAGGLSFNLSEKVIFDDIGHIWYLMKIKLIKKLNLTFTYRK